MSRLAIAEEGPLDDDTLKMVRLKMGSEKSINSLTLPTNRKKVRSYSQRGTKLRFKVKNG